MLAFTFPGQGAQHPDMGRGLYVEEAVFRAEIDSSAERLLPLLGRDLRELLFPPADQCEEAARELRQTRFAQPALFAVELALARLWISWGIRPEAMIGHSLGEYVAACLAGVFSADDALELVAARGALMQELPPGAMLSVELSAGELAPELEALPGLSLAAVNAPSLCVVSGADEAVAALEARLAGRDVQMRRLRTSHAFHSPMMDPVVAAFSARVARVARKPPAIPFLSNLTGTWITADQATDPGYWGRHLRATVRFADGLAALLAGSRAALLEVGPGTALTELARRQSDPAARPAPIASLGRAGAAEPEPAAVLTALGRLWLAGAEADWPAFHAGGGRRRILLPTYPFQRRRYWIEPGHTGLAALHEAEATALQERPGIDTPYEEPGTGTERRLAMLWGHLLGIDRVGVHDDFFALGGHSLLATRLLSRVCEEFAREIPLEAVFNHPTVARFAAHLDVRLDVQLDDIQPRIPRADRAADLPLSFAQQQIWVLQQLDPADPSYGLPGAFRLRGDLDPDAVAWSLRTVVERHEVLRTTYPAVQGWPRQRIATAAAVPFPVIDLEALGVARAERDVQDLLVRESLRPFDLAREPTWRAALFRFAAGDHLLWLCFHHIGFDGWSWGVLFAELASLYAARRAGRPSPLPPLQLQYADFASWQRDPARQDAREAVESLDWWRRRLAGRVPLQLAPEPPPGSTPRGGVETFQLAPELSEALGALAQAEGCTLFMVLLSLFKLLLQQRTGQDDIAVGSPVAGRRTSQVEGMLGNFVNTLVLRTALAPRLTFRELLARIKETALGAYFHQETPYEQVAASLHGRSQRARLFEVWFVLHNTPMPALELPGLTAEMVRLSGTAPRHDLSLSLRQGGHGLEGTLDYRADLFSPSAVRQMAADFTTLAHAVATDPDAAGQPCSTLCGLLERNRREHQESRQQAVRSAGLEKLRARRRETAGRTAEEWSQE